MDMLVLSRKKKVIITFCTVIMLYFVLVGTSCASFTLEDEKRLGREFYEKIRERGMLLEDQNLVKYIDTIGRRILAQGDEYPLDFTFSVIENAGINAFATPGGYVYVYAGLIGLAENEDQIAGVLAHEIAHVKARHIARAIEKSKKMNIATIAAILAGAFLGGGEGAAALSGLAMAATTTMNLKYSRDHEEEADRLGMSYIVGARYDEKGMLDFLKRMRQYEYYSNKIPSYFLTHPGTGDRIAYLTVLIQSRYAHTEMTDAVGGFQRIKTRLMLDTQDCGSNMKYFAEKLRENPDDIEALYGLAVTESKIGKIEESHAHFARAITRAPGDYEIIRDFGISYYEAGDTAKAIEFLKKSYAVKSDDPETLRYLGRSYESTGNLTTALDLYKKLYDLTPSDSDIYYHLAMTYGKLDNMGESHFYFGKYFKEQEKKSSALFHFKAALEQAQPESARAAEIKEEIASFEPGHQGKQKKAQSTEH